VRSQLCDEIRFLFFKNGRERVDDKRRSSARAAHHRMRLTETDAQIHFHGRSLGSLPCERADRLVSFPFRRPVSSVLFPFQSSARLHVTRRRSGLRSKFHSEIFPPRPSPLPRAYQTKGAILNSVVLLLFSSQSCTRRPPRAHRLRSRARLPRRR
jgi:hypothetical protein